MVLIIFGMDVQLKRRRAWKMMTKNGQERIGTFNEDLSEKIGK